MPIQLRSRSVTAKSDKMEATVTVSEATVASRMRRDIYRRRSAEYLKENLVADPTVAFLAYELFPDLVGATLEAKIVYTGDKSALQLRWPPTVEEFLAMPEMPDGFMDDWYEVVYELNPHWKRQKKEDSQDETKKESPGNPTTSMQN